MRSFLLWLLLVGTANAQGVSYIGFCNPTWDCDATLKTFRNRPAVVGWLENSFGNRCVCADRILREPTREKIIRVHLANSPCLRNKRCGSHDLFFNHTVKTANQEIKRPRSRLRKKFNRIVTRFAERLAAARGAVTCYVSPCLECDLDDKSRKILLGIVRQRLPSCVPVDNPFGADCLRGFVCEKHGPDRPKREPCIYDFDGTEAESVIDLRQTARETRACDLRFYWSHWMNCNTMGGAFVPPMERECKATGKMMQNAGDKAWDRL